MALAVIAYLWVMGAWLFLVIGVDHGAEVSFGSILWVLSWPVMAPVLLITSF